MKKLRLLSFIASLAFLAACSSDELPPVVPPTPDEPELPVVSEKYEIVGDNLYYDEIQLGASKSFCVEPKELEEGSKAEGIVWYLNDAKAGTGVSFTFTPVTEGVYNLKYAIAKENSKDDKEHSKTVKVVAYKMGGVFVLEESNLSASEACRGVSMYTFGSGKVEDYIKGDFTSFGVTQHYIQNWAGNLYNLSGLATNGVALSQFSTGDAPKMLAAVTAFDAPVKTFSGIDEERGVITTASANLIDLKTLTVKAVLKGSAGATNTLVTEGYVFVITAEGAKAYKTDGLSADTEPKLLGAATIGFVKSKDGSVLAFNKNELLQINPKDLTTKVIPLPAGVEAKNSSNPWKQFALAASAKENVVFWMNDSSWGTGKEIYKYNVDTNTLTKDFIALPADGYMFYGPCLLYNAEADELICAALKGYGPDFSESAFYTYNASTGAKTGELLFSTLESGSDMWANGMMAPIKVY